MNLCKFLIVFFLFSYLPTYGQWKKVTNIPRPYDNAYYLDVYFLESNPRFGWACGKDGVVARTTDGGDSWQVTVIPFAYQLESIHFVNERVGYTSGLYNGPNTTSAIFKSTDGGRTWTNVSPFGNIDVWGTFFLTENTGMTIGGGCQNDQQFYRTTDGGRSWRVFRTNIPNSGLSDLIIDKNTGIGYAVSSGWIWRTTDFGMTWNLFSKSGNNDWQEEITLNGNTFLLPYSEGCTGGGDGGARISTDMGKSWRQFNWGIPMFGSFLNTPQSGWVVGWQRSAYYTSDAGKTWHLKNCGIPANADLDDIWFINDTLGFVVGLGIYKFIGLNIEKPKILTSTTGPYCEGDTVILYLNRTYDQYKWSDGSTSPTLKVTKSGTYWAFAQHNECDSATSDPITITFLPKTNLSLKLSDTTKLCEGDTVWVTASGDFLEFNWSDGQTGSNALFTKSGKYYITAIDKNGCKTRDSISLNFSPLPIAEIVVSGPTNFCIGDSTLLSSKFPSFSYKWIDSSGNVISNEKSIKVFQSGTFRLLLENEFGCSSISNPVSVIVRYDTNKLALSYQPFLQIDSTQFPKISCSKLKIENISWQTQTITNISLFRNLAFSIPQSQLPIIIPPFSTVEVTVCFSPLKMGIDRDTIYIGDLCTPHMLPLVAYGIPNEYQSNTRCDVPLQFTTLDIIDNTDFIIEKPIPNPATNSIKFQIAVKSDEIIEISISNVVGKILKQFQFAYGQNQSANNSNYKVMEITLDISDLPNDVYLMQVKSSSQKRVLKFIKLN